jgi:(S)-mandelate dehydrogenase
MARDLRGVFSIDEFRRLAKARLPRPVFDFYEGGAEDEQTLRANLAAFERTPLRPRAFIDVSAASTACTLLGGPAAAPMAIAPMGAVAYGWRGGDAALARAAHAAGLPYTLSTMAATSIEELARQAGGRLWFQAHLLLPRERTLQLVDRARDAGYEALMVTADLPVGGRRERDLRNGVSMPMRFTPANVLAFARKPAWSLGMLLRGAPAPAQAGPGPSAGSSIGGNFDPAFDWQALEQLRARWPRKFIVKGILDPQDAQRCAALGIDAVVVSNHGGRQLDGCMAALDALPAVAAAVAGRCTVLMDGGVRRGRDVLKALLAGADGVLLGRAALWGVCAAGEPGARHALALLQQELLTAMKLCGIAALPALHVGTRAPTSE